MKNTVKYRKQYSENRKTSQTFEKKTFENYPLTVYWLVR